MIYTRMGLPMPRQRLILHTEASLGLGGQEIRILTEARWLLDHGWSALIAAQPESRLLSEARAAELPAVAVRMRGALDLPALLALRRLMRARGVALAHTHSSVDSWLGTLAAKSLRLPVVRGRHVTIPIVKRRALTYRLADRVITSGEAVRTLVQRAGVPAERIVAVAAGVDAMRFHPGVSGKTVRDELGLTSPVVGLVANVRGSKGHRYFLEAAPEVLRAVPGTRFLIVGDGVGFEGVRRRVREMGLEPHVIMTGFRRDIPEVMAALDVLVLPSVKSEAISQVIPQALAVGTPVVGTTVGGTPEIIRDGENGRLVPPADAAALAGAIVALLRDPPRAREMARAGQALVQARYTMDATMAQTTAVYAELLGG
ncbi:MAG TPA: glycosyltransferase family 4 protein [Methylomirabilota bacterium]|jgi:glycosyltransferase involved in cell wall biosynthesis|nr:glycosyltransferase family 4 protein [Methylomirabilota bacterium]